MSEEIKKCKECGELYEPSENDIGLCGNCESWVNQKIEKE